jgi:hypothetical protein
MRHTVKHAPGTPWKCLELLALLGGFLKKMLVSEGPAAAALSRRRPRFVSASFPFVNLSFVQIKISLESRNKLLEVFMQVHHEGYLAKNVKRGSVRRYYVLTTDELVLQAELCAR